MNQDTITPLERFTAPTPKFFAIIRNAGIIIGIVGLTIAKMQTEGINLPDFLNIIAEKATTISALIAAIVAQFTVDFKKTATENALKGFKK